MDKVEHLSKVNLCKYWTNLWLPCSHGVSWGGWDAIGNLLDAGLQWNSSQLLAGHLLLAFLSSVSLCHLHSGCYIRWRKTIDLFNFIDVEYKAFLPW